MSRRRIAAVVLRQFYLMRGSIARVLPLFIWVAVDMVLWGFITRYLNAISRAGLDFVPTLLGAVLLWDYFTRVMQGVTITFLEGAWSRKFLSPFAPPISIGEYVMGLIVSSLLTSALGLVVMLVLATLFFGLSFLGYGAALIPFLLILVIFGLALGVVGSAVVLRLGPASEWFIWPIPALVAPFASKQGVDGAASESGRRRHLLIVRIRRPLRRGRRRLLQLVERDSDRALQLRIVPGGDRFRIELHFHVGRDARVLGNPLTARAEEADVRRGDKAAIHQRREAEDADQSTPGALPDKRAGFRVAEHPRQHIAAGSRRLVDDHHRRPVDGSTGRLLNRAIAERAEPQERPVHDVDEVVSHLAAAIEPFVENDALLVHLREKVPVETGQSAFSRVGEIHVRELATAQCVDLAAVGLDPRQIAEASLGGHRHDPDVARVRARRIGPDP